MKKIVIVVLLFLLSGCQLLQSSVTVTLLIPTEDSQSIRLDVFENEGQFIEAPSLEGMTFSYWLDEDYRLISSQAQLEINHPNDLTLYAVYQDTLGRTVLPNVLNLNQEEGKELLNALGFRVSVFERKIENALEDKIVDYGQFMVPGQLIQQGTSITLIVSQPLPYPEFYEFIEDVTYDGPRLAMERVADINQAYETVNGVQRGTGYAFSVGYRPGRRNVGGGCIDGDTTIFQYPNEIFNIIASNAKSTRYFNVDTPETFSGGEEPFGRLATEYVCDVLERAEAIVLQTDPGDNLLDRYGRFLAWIWVLMPGEDDYELLNYKIVRRGLGEVRYLFGAGETQETIYEGKTYTEWMFLAEEKAIEDGLGLFGNQIDPYWDYVTDQPIQSP